MSWDAYLLLKIRKGCVLNSPQCPRAESQLCAIQHSKSGEWHFKVSIPLLSLGAFWIFYFFYFFILGFLSQDLHLDAFLIRILKIKLFSG